MCPEAPLIFNLLQQNKSFRRIKAFEQDHKHLTPSPKHPNNMGFSKDMCVNFTYFVLENVLVIILIFVLKIDVY